MSHDGLTDGVVATGALTSALWVELVHEGLGLYVLLGGAVLLTMRCIIAWRDLRGKKK